MDFVKRCLRLSLLILFLQQCLFSQRLVYDAAYLKGFVHNQDGKSYLNVANDSVANILMSYVPDSARKSLNASFRYKVLQKYYDNVGGAGIANPFIDLPGEQQETRNFSLSGLSTGLANAGGLDVTNLADGMAKFLVARTKQELAAAFFDRFKTTLADSNYMDLRTLFPLTYSTLGAIGEQIYNYDAFIQTLRESFEKDLRQLATNLPTVVDNHPGFFGRHKELAALLQSGCYVAEELNENQHPGQILCDYPSSILDSLNRNWEGAIQTLQLISESLRDSAQVTDSTSYWVSPRQIANLVADSVAFKIYLGLLYQQASNLRQSVRFEGGWTLCRVFDSVALNFAKYYGNYRLYYTSLAEKENKLTTLLNAQKKISNDSESVQEYYSYAIATADFLEAASDVGKLVPIEFFKTDDKVRDFFEHSRNSMEVFFGVAKSSVDVVWEIKRRSYASAIVDIVTIYNRTIADSAHVELVAANAKLASWLDRLTDKVAGKSALIASQDSLQSAIRQLQAEVGFVGPFLRYGTFMATIVQANNSDEVEAAIEAIALPAGSSRIKRENPFNVSLNSYVGGFVGREIVDRADNNPFINSYGATAVIGVAISEARSLFFIPCDQFFFSSSAFISLVDIGAVTTYRVTNDSTQSIPTIQLKDIFSPGLFYSIGVDKTPLSLNFGYQLGPLLRKIQASQGSFTNAYSRWSFSLCVDIPLLDFYTMPRE